MLEDYNSSPFIDAAAVEAWDAWFRWRENGRLRDISVEATWQRVARALAQAEPGASARWAQRFFDAQSRWQFVLDERVLATAGTGHATWPSAPVAALNATAFVVGAFTPKAHIDDDALRDAAALAVRCLDNVRILQGGHDRQQGDPRVGLIGVADALALLGKRYDNPGGRVLAGGIARALAEGCFAANVRLAAERAPNLDNIDAPLAIARARSMPQDLIDDATRHGLRHARLTAITSQRRLALFANNVADALDPLDGTQSSKSIAVSGVLRTVHSPGYASTLARRNATTGIAPADAATAIATASIIAQIALRGAVQPWIDVPIDCPFRLDNEPEPTFGVQLQQLAAAHRLGELRWREASAVID